MLNDTSIAVRQAGLIHKRLDEISAAGKMNVDASSKKLTAILGGGGGFFAPPSADVTLSRVNGQAATLYQQVWQADAAPTSAQMDALTSAEHDHADVMKRWEEFKASDLPALNHQLHDAQTPEIRLDSDPPAEEPQADEE